MRDAALQFQVTERSSNDILHYIFKVSCESPPAPQQQGTAEQTPSDAVVESAGGNDDSSTEGDADSEDENDDDDEAEEGFEAGEDIDMEQGNGEREAGNSRDTANQEPGSAANNTDTTAVNNAPATDNTQNASQSNASVTPDRKTIWATLLVPDLDRNAELTECLMALLRFTLMEQVAMPYMTRIHCDVAGQLPISAYTDRHDSDLLSTASRSINLHRMVIQSLRGYCSCDRHGEGAVETPWDECPCVRELKKWTLLLQDANPILEKFCKEVINLRRPLHAQLKEILEKISSLLEAHGSLAVSFLRKVQRKMPNESKEYWKSCDCNQNVTETAQTDEPEDEFVWNEIGMCFPGRSLCRPGIVFETKESQHCTKKYPKSQTHSPGLLTVQCACPSPKLIGFIIMTRAESTALALSAVLMHFKIPPRTVYYDNACNLFASVFLRLPWLLSRTRVAVDRFHYKSHTCTAFFSPDSYRVLDRESTETAESFNARIEKTLPHMRYLGSENLIPFLYNRIAHLNVAALFKEKYNRRDLEDVDIGAFFRSIYSCDCDLCEKFRALEATEGENDPDTKGSTSGEEATTLAEE